MSRAGTAPGPVRVAHLMPYPVEYFVPLYREIAQRPEVDLTVFYYSDETTREFYDREFGRSIEWDIPLLDGYRSRFLPSSERTDMSGRFWKRPNWDIVREVASGRYDVIWAHGYAHLTSWLAALVARPRGTRLLLRDAQTLLGERPRWKRALKRVMLPLLYRQGVGAYVGEEARRHFVRHGMPPDRLFPARHCVDNAFFQEAAARLAPRRTAIRALFGIDDDAPVVLSCGKLVETKGPLGLVEAFAAVRRRHRAWLLFAGDGALRGAIVDLAARLGVDGVRITGFLNQTELPAAYVAADVFALPSRNEVWGMVVNEAMSFSLPLVVSDRVGSAADLVRPGWNGFVVPRDDAGALAGALEALVADPALRREYGANSRSLVDSYSLERCADELVAACLAASLRHALPSRRRTRPSRRTAIQQTRPEEGT